MNILIFIGKDVKDDFLEKMMNEAPGGGPINFTMFLTLFGEKLTGTDPEEVIRNAFQCFDEDCTGRRLTKRLVITRDQPFSFLGAINEDYLRELLTTMGDRYTDEQVDELFKDAPIKDGMFNYIEFTRMLKHGTKDKDEQ